MSTTLLPPDDDTRTDVPARHNLKAKKEKVIQPLHNSLPSLNIPHADKDLLAELQQKTAELAEKMQQSHKDLKSVHDLGEVITKHDSDSIESEQLVDLPTVQPTEPNPAADLIRDKLARLYKKEPDAAEEAIESYEVEQIGGHRSKHQKFMYDLTTSGKSLAEIQTSWHNYYVGLPDNEKHEVWKEFYDTQNELKHSLLHARHPSKKPDKKPTYVRKKLQRPDHESHEIRSVADIKKTIIDKVSAGGKLKASHHLKSLAFGLGLAAGVGGLLFLTLFNEVVIAPFISPSSSVSATPIIAADSQEVGPESKIIIPKINLEVPVVFDMDTVAEDAIQRSLEEGVVHYATTPNPGEKGNVAIVGHSSNNILNKGKYKFAFVLLKRLENDDTFFVQRNGIRYTYRVYKSDIVTPDNINVLDTQDKPNTITLITCDPPGTSINRLVVVAEQIAPDPSQNGQSTALTLEQTEQQELPSNAPTLWSRLWPF